MCAVIKLPDDIRPEEITWIEWEENSVPPYSLDSYTITGCEAQQQGTCPFVAPFFGKGVRYNVFMCDGAKDPYTPAFTYIGFADDYAEAQMIADMDMAAHPKYVGTYPVFRWL